MGKSGKRQRDNGKGAPTLGSAWRFRPDQFEQLLAQSSASKFVFRLYVAGSNLHSLRALENIRRLCREYLKGRFELDVIDLYQQPALAERDQIVTAPTLVKISPQPSITFTGDLDDTERILRSLGITPFKVQVLKNRGKKE